MPPRGEVTYSRATVRFPRCCRAARAETRHPAVWRGPMRAHMSGIARIRPRVSRVPVVSTGCPVGSRGTRPSLSVPLPRPVRSSTLLFSAKFLVNLGKLFPPVLLPRRGKAKLSLSIYLFLKRHPSSVDGLVRSRCESLLDLRRWGRIKIEPFSPLKPYSRVRNLTRRRGFSFCPPGSSDLSKFSSFRS